MMLNPCRVPKFPLPAHALGNSSMQQHQPPSSSAPGSGGSSQLASGRPKLSAQVHRGCWLPALHTADETRRHLPHSTHSSHSSCPPAGPSQLSTPACSGMLRTRDAVLVRRRAGAICIATPCRLPACNMTPSTGTIHSHMHPCMARNRHVHGGLMRPRLLPQSQPEEILARSRSACLSARLLCAGSSDSRC